MSTPPMPPPPKPPPLKANLPPPPPASKAVTSDADWSVEETKRIGQRIVIYADGGVGKSCLAALAPNPVFGDLDNGAPPHAKIAKRAGVPIKDWLDILAFMRSKAAESFQTIVIDSATKAQDAALAHTLATVEHENGHRVTSIEGYGYGKGYQHLYDTFLGLLQAADEVAASGRNVILVCHQCTATTPNPNGDDYLRFEPDMQQVSKNGRLRDRLRNWCDHLLFISTDVLVKEKTGVAIGGITRTIYPQGAATFWAKSRTLRDPIPYPEGSAEVWDQLFGGQNK